MLCWCSFPCKWNQHLQVFNFCCWILSHHNELIKRFQTIYKTCFWFPKMSLFVLWMHSDQRQHGAWVVSAASSQQGLFVWVLALVLWMCDLSVLADFVPVSCHTKWCFVCHASCDSQTVTVWNYLNMDIVGFSQLLHLTIPLSPRSWRNGCLST